LQENQGRQSRIEETTKLIAFKEEQLAALDLQYKETVGNLTLTSNQLKETLEELSDKRNALTEALHELKDVKQLLQEQIMLTNAHSTTEGRLHRLAGGLVGTLKTSVADISTLHSTLGKTNKWNSDDKWNKC
jgi:chromosome segregation ATPase